MIEESASTELERGFHVGTYNKRGVTSRGLDEGGEQELRLAQQYNCWADVVADQWPRTAAVLRALASGYRAEAHMHDEDSRRVRAGLRG
jgi:hypothetical protein